MRRLPVLLRAAADTPPSAQASNNQAAGPIVARRLRPTLPPTADAPPSAGSDLAAQRAGAPGAEPPSATRPVNPNAAVPPRTRVASAAPPPANRPASPPVEAQAPVPSTAPVASTAAAAPPPGAEPAVPAVPMTAGTRMAMINPTDAQLGFRPSSAPPLSAGLSNWVAPPTLAHYRQTAALAGSAGIAGAAVPAVGGRRSVASGDVVANLDGVPGSPAGMAAAMNGGMPPAAIIYFPGDATNLSKMGMAEVRQAVAAFKAQGGAGTIKVVGHASSRTGNMPVERHLELIFQKSQARANAVAQALIRAGVPAAQVQIEAVGDSQPVYYESMPKGEDGNRRAEIYLQG